MVPQKDLFQLSRLVLNSGIKVRLLAIALASIWILAACTPRVESGAVLFEDDFEVAGSGWPEQSDVEAITGYEDGAVCHRRACITTYCLGISRKGFLGCDH